MIKDPQPASIPTAEVAGTNSDTSSGVSAIVSNSLNKTYSEGLIFKKKFRALSDVTFSVNRGEIFGLLGPNGAGKTTFIKILLGIIRKSSGDATMLGASGGQSFWAKSSRVSA